MSLEKHQKEDMNELHECRLSPADERLLDSLVDGGFDPAALESLSHEDHARSRRLVHLLGLMNDYPVDDADETLIHATLARVDRAEARRSSRFVFEDNLEDHVITHRRRLRVPDFLSVAAIILIGIGVLWPLMSEVRTRAHIEACSNNHRLLSYAFGNYAADYDGAMPIARAGLGGTWDTIANTINLKPLVENDYCERGHLQCPGAHDPSTQSYSYQWQLPGASTQWDQAHTTVVLGDRNPIIDAANHGEYAAPLTISLNHRGRGQNVLSSDGSNIWLTQPVIGRDNIWLPEGLTVLLRGARTSESADVFLAH